MLVNNISGRALFLGFYEKMGITIPLGATAFTLNDSVASKPEFVAMIGTDLTISSYDTTDAGNITQPEFNALNDGLYRVVANNSPIATVVAMVQAAEETAVSAPFDWRTPNNVFDFTFDNTFAGTVTVPSGIYAVTTAVGVLNADAWFSTYAVASVTSTDHITITTRAYGTSARVVSTYFDLDTAGTGTPSRIKYLVKGTQNELKANGQIVVTLYTTVGGAGVNADALVQVVRKGTVVSGLYGNPAVLASGADGEIDFEVADKGTGVADVFLNVAVPTGYFLAAVPSGARPQI